MTCADFTEWLSERFVPNRDDQSPLLERMFSDESLLCGIGVQMLDLDAVVLFLCDDGMLESTVTIWSDGPSRAVGELEFEWLFWRGDVSENVRDVSPGRLHQFTQECEHQRDVAAANVRVLKAWREKMQPSAQR